MDDKEIKEYELSFLLKSEADLAAVEKALAESGVSVFYNETPRQIRLAYPVNKHESAHFGFSYFKTDDHNAIAVLRQKLQLIPVVLRFLIITPPVPRRLRVEQRQAAVKTVVPIVEQRAPALSNEALEQKLEEILK